MILEKMAQPTRELLMFRYFILLGLLFSCSGDNSKKEQKDQQETVETEVAVEPLEKTKTILFFWG